MQQPVFPYSDTVAAESAELSIANCALVFHGLLEIQFLLGLIVRCLADAVELCVLLALFGARRRDHLLLLGLG